MFTKKLKNAFGYAGVILLAIIAYAFFINPYGCNQLQEGPVFDAQLKAKRLYLSLEKLRARGEDPWPRAPVMVEKSSDDCRKGVYDSSVAYFDWLFQMDCYGSDGWTPCIAGQPISLVTSDEFATSLTTNNIMWSVAEGVNDETPGWAIVLASANLDCAHLLSSYDGISDIPIQTTDDRPIVVIRKNGMVYAAEPKRLNARYLYSHHAFSGGPKSYLTPQGRVWTKR